MKQVVSVVMYSMCICANCQATVIQCIVHVQYDTVHMYMYLYVQVPVSFKCKSMLAMFDLSIKNEAY